MRTRYAVTPRALDVRRVQSAAFNTPRLLRRLIGRLIRRRIGRTIRRVIHCGRRRAIRRAISHAISRAISRAIRRYCLFFASTKVSDQSCNQSCNPSPLFVLREHQSHASLVVQTVSLRQLCSFSHHHHHQYVACPEEGKINRVDSSSFVSTVYFSQLTSTGSQPSRNKVVKGHHTQVNQTNQHHTCNPNRTIRS